MQNIDKIDLKLNAGTKQKLLDFYYDSKFSGDKWKSCILLLQITKKSGLVQELKDATPEGMAKVQNIEELLNGIKDFTEGQKKLMVLVVPYLNSWKMLHWRQI
jgi:DNA helicase-2/ATP-dependent DNA helicase PcrA